MATLPTTTQVLGMQLKTDGNHPTDAINIVNSDINRIINKGLTKREYFAAMAMQGIMSYPRMQPNESEAAFCVEMADALIEALNK